MKSIPWLYYLKLPFKRWAYELLDQLVIFLVKPGNEGGLLVFRLDLLGDYLVCRPFFNCLVRDAPFGETSFSFAGNKMLQDFAEVADAEVFSDFTWIDRGKFMNSLWYRWKILSGIRRRGFSTVINPSHTRQYWLESVVRISGAKRRIAASATGRYMNSWEQSLADSWYSSILVTGNEPCFEFFRNQAFFRQFAPSAGLVTGMGAHRLPQSHRKKLILLAPGASTEERRWPAEHFAALAEALAEEFPDFRFGLTGSPAEEELCRGIALHCPASKPEVFAGHLSLTDSVKLISEATLLVANESGSVHIAAGSGTPCVCISNGNHFGRWNPYPESVAADILTCYPGFFFPLESKKSHLLLSFHDHSSIPASEVDFEQVRSACVQLISDALRNQL
jgi:ADP-heptose:LPS heptosyltransferase